MSRAEAAALLEKKHLKECEENDYRILEGLFEARGSIDAGVQPYEVTVIYYLFFIQKLKLGCHRKRNHRKFSIKIFRV